MYLLRSYDLIGIMKITIFLSYCMLWGLSNPYSPKCILNASFYNSSFIDTDTKSVVLVATLWVFDTLVLVIIISGPAFKILISNMSLLILQLLAIIAS